MLSLIEGNVMLSNILSLGAEVVWLGWAVWSSKVISGRRLKTLPAGSGGGGLGGGLTRLQRGARPWPSPRTSMSGGTVSWTGRPVCETLPNQPIMRLLDADILVLFQNMLSSFRVFIQRPSCRTPPPPPSLPVTWKDAKLPVPGKVNPWMPWGSYIS